MTVSELIEKLKPKDADQRYAAVILKVSGENKEMFLVECKEARYDAETGKVILS